MPPVVLITGCSQGGIGHAFCEEYASNGCIVYATARRPEAMDSLTHENIRKLTLDVLVEEDAQAVVNRIIEEVGKIDVLVNNAGALSAATSTP